MYDISRKQLDRISQLLQNHVNTDESIKLAKSLQGADIIPKLYAYTYFQKVFDECKKFKVYKKSFDFDDEFSTFIEDMPALQLQGIKNKREINIVYEIIQNGLNRMDEFCDFNDSKYHNKIIYGSCENEDHETFEYEDTNGNIIETRNENLLLKPVYTADEDTYKYEDKPEWWCEDCSNSIDPADMDVTVNCDMDLENV